jgi:hypothetical protein
MQGEKPEHWIPQPPQLLRSVLVSVHWPKHVTCVVQLRPQLVPSHVVVSYLLPAGQGEQRVPQLLTDVLLTQLPLQSCCVDEHLHTPLWQVLPPVQMLPQVPQLLLSVRRSTHLPEQSK